jgi:uncharacterized protein (TIGR02271 family)
MKTESKRNLEQYINHTVVDQNGNKIGKLHCLWTDANNEPVYLGVQTGWLRGKTHVVPADGAQVNEASKTIRLPYTTGKIKDALCYDPSAELDAATEREIRDYYNLSQRSAERSKATQEPESATMKLHEEQIKVGKRQVEAGGVRLRKIVRVETVNQPVELQTEEIIVERVPAGAENAPAGKSGADFQQEEIYIPLRREEAVLQKESRVREEVRVRKKARTERKTVSEQVRKEDVELQQSESTSRSAGIRQQSGSATDSTARRGTQPTGQKQRASKRGKRAVFALCRTEQQASQIVDELKRAGFSNNDISVLFPDKSGTRDFAHEKSTKAPEAAATGAGAGGLLGGALGWLAGVGALAIPGIGPFVAAGPIMAALGGAAIGAGTGGLIGALVGLGMPEYEAKRYEGKLKEGNILISVHSENADETRRAKEIFERAGAEDISTTGEEKVVSHAE